MDWTVPTSLADFIEAKCLRKVVRVGHGDVLADEVPPVSSSPDRTSDLERATIVLVVEMLVTVVL